MVKNETKEMNRMDTSNGMGRDTEILHRKFASTYAASLLRLIGRILYTQTGNDSGCVSHRKDMECR